MKHQRSRTRNILFTVLALIHAFLLGQFVAPSVLLAEGLTKDIVESVRPQTLNLVVGKSVVLNSSQPIKRASLANPGLASTLVLSPTQLYLNGKAIGGTNLTFWGRDGKVFAIYDVRVSPDLKRLKTHLHELFPNEKEIQVRSAHDHITLAGAVSGPEIMTQVLGLAQTYAPKKVMNLMHVGGVQQVMLEVKVAEMAKGVLKRLGTNWIFQRSGSNTLGLLDSLTSFEQDDTGNITQLLGTTINMAYGFNFGGETLLLALAALKQHNLTKILAEPTLVSLSGQEASFLAGGEFPVPVPQAFGVTTIKFKDFGVSLKFNPTVLGDGKISLKIAPEVSELDFSSGINSQGFTIPALLTRKVQTIVELRDGQSFAIAGLLQDNIREAIAKYPVLGDLPVLGALFRSTSFQKNETELVIIVTPRLVKPFDAQKQALPTDAYLEPNDFEFMLMGYLEGVRRSSSQIKANSSKKMSGDKSTKADIGKVSSKQSPGVPLPISGGGLEGQFGHLAP